MYTWQVLLGLLTWIFVLLPPSPLPIHSLPNGLVASTARFTQEITWYSQTSSDEGLEHNLKCTYFSIVFSLNFDSCVLSPVFQSERSSLEVYHNLHSLNLHAEWLTRSVAHSEVALSVTDDHKIFLYSLWFKNAAHIHWNSLPLSMPTELFCSSCFSFRISVLFCTFSLCKFNPSGAFKNYIFCCQFQFMANITSMLWCKLTTKKRI